MNKKLISGLLLSATINVFAQLGGRAGINTPDPKTTLDVSGILGSNGKSPNTDVTGLQAPRLTREELTNKGNSLYGVNQKGAIIYITNVSAGDATLQRINVTSEGYYYFDGSVWLKLQSSPVNIYNSDGTLTADRNVTMSGRYLAFTSANQRTIFSANSGIRQEGLSTANNANIMVAAPDKNSNGVESRLTIQAFSESAAQLLAEQDATSIDIGTHFTTAPSYIRLVTSAGSNAIGTEKIRVTSDGKMGISTSVPSETLDVGSGNVRIRNINSNISNNSSDKYIVTDTSGVLKVADLFVPKTSIIGLNNGAAANTSANTIANVTFGTNPLLSGFTYNSSTGVYTANSAGYYQITTTVNKDVSMNVSATGGTSAIYVLVNGTIENSQLTGYLDGSQGTSQNMTYVVYLSAGENFQIATSYTRTSRITKAQVSVIALGG